MASPLTSGPWVGHSSAPPTAPPTALHLCLNLCDPYICALKKPASQWQSAALTIHTNSSNLIGQLLRDIFNSCYACLVEESCSSQHNTPLLQAAAAAASLPGQQRTSPQSVTTSLHAMSNYTCVLFAGGFNNGTSKQCTYFSNAGHHILSKGMGSCQLTPINNYTCPLCWRLQLWDFQAEYFSNAGHLSFAMGFHPLIIAAQLARWMRWKLQQSCVYVSTPCLHLRSLTLMRNPVYQNVWLIDANMWTIHVTQWSAQTKVAYQLSFPQSCTVEFLSQWNIHLSYPKMASSLKAILVILFPQYCTLCTHTVNPHIHLAIVMCCSHQQVDYKI